MDNIYTIQFQTYSISLFLQYKILSSLNQSIQSYFASSVSHDAQITLPMGLYRRWEAFEDS